LTIQDVSQTAQTHLLYTRFQSVSNQLAPLLSELERRAQAYPSDLSSLLTECHTAYFAARKALLVPRLSEEIRGLDPMKTELVELVSYHYYSDMNLHNLHDTSDSRGMQLSEATLYGRV
jgi:conserved oligomeric Golgi complex subunit 3